MSVLLALTAAILFGLGTWLLLQRRLTRIVIGLGLIGHGTNILLLTSGGGGGLPPVIGTGDKDEFADPLPQALALTAIVITFGVTAFLLAMAYRSWQLTHDDVVADDLEDRLIERRRGQDEIDDVEAADLEAQSDSSGDDDHCDRGAAVNSALVPLPDRAPAVRGCGDGRVRPLPHRAAGRVARRIDRHGRRVDRAARARPIEHDVVTMDAGGWAAPLGITYVVDRLAAIMLVTSSLMLLVVQIYAIGQRGVADHHVGFAPIYLVLASGVSASFITGDMFNLFVAFEMMLAASYVLLTLGGRQDQVRAGMTYVVISLRVLRRVHHCARPALRGDRHGEHGRPRRADARAVRRCADRVLAAPAAGVRHQGRSVPALLLAARQLPDRTRPGDGDLRRPAHQGRACTRSSAPRRCCSRPNRSRARHC